MPFLKSNFYHRIRNSAFRKLKCTNCRQTLIFEQFYFKNIVFLLLVLIPYFSKKLQGRSTGSTNLKIVSSISHYYHKLLLATFYSKINHQRFKIGH